MSMNLKSSLHTLSYFNSSTYKQPAAISRLPDQKKKYYENTIIVLLTILMFGQKT